MDSVRKLLILSQAIIFSAIASSCSKEFGPSEKINIPVVGSEASEIGMDYTELDRLLAEGNLEKADNETTRIFLELSENENISDYPPCADLKTIDDLWSGYSSGNYSFSSQYAIYKELREDYKEFGGKVKWWSKKEDKWVPTEISFQKKIYATGHLPALAAFRVPCDAFKDVCKFGEKRGWFAVLAGDVGEADFNVVGGYKAEDLEETFLYADLELGENDSLFAPGKAMSFQPIEAWVLNQDYFTRLRNADEGESVHYRDIKETWDWRETVFSKIFNQFRTCDFKDEAN